MALTASRTTKGFELVGFLHPGIVDPGLREFEVTPSLTVEKGDMVVLSYGKVALATSASVSNILGVAAEKVVATATGGEKIQVYTGAFNVYRCSFSDHQDLTATGGSTTTLVAQLAIHDTNDDPNGTLIHVYEGTNAGCTRTVSDYDHASDTLTVSVPFPAAIDTTSKFIVLGECDDAGTSIINVGTTGVQLKDEDTIDANAATDADDGPLGVVAIYPQDLMMDVFITRPRFGSR